MQPLPEALKALGWNDGKAAVYSTLVENGAMKPADLVVKAGVAQGKIYTVLDELVNRGVVVKIGDRPAVYDAQHPREVLNSELAHIQKSKDKAIDAAEEAYERRYDQKTREAACWTVRGMGGIQIQLASLLEGCKSSVKIADRNLRWLVAPDAVLTEKLSDKKVQVVGPDEARPSLEELCAGGKVEAYECMCDETFCLVDDEVVMVRFESPDCALFVRDRDFARPYVDKFGRYLEEGEKVRVLQIAS